MHKIQNIDFQARLSYANTNMSWERYYAKFLEHSFLPKVDDLFEAWSAKHPDIDCIIEEMTLETNLEDNDLISLEHELLRQLRYQLESIKASDADRTSELQVRLLPAKSLFESFLIYLKSGFIPEGLVISELKQWLLKGPEFSRSEKARITELVAQDLDALLRLSHSLQDQNYVKLAQIVQPDPITQPLKLPDVFVAKLIIHLGIELKMIMQPVQFKKWIRILKKASGVPRFKDLLVELLRTDFTITPIDSTRERLLELVIIQALIQHQHLKTIEIDFTVIFSADTQAATDRSDRQRSTDTKEPDNVMEVVERDTPDQDSMNSKVEVEGIEQELADVRSPQSPDTPPPKTRHELPKAILNTEKAGLLLLHPFLMEFLKEQVLLRDDNSISDPVKAAHLLHFLATGNQKPLDMELNLEKILLNIPLAEVIDVREALLPEDEQLCAALLGAVLKHWGIFKSSSAGTLRDMFLKRSGSISVNPENIHISVEKLAQDVLLNKLPWNIGIIKLPWISKLIHVEW